MSKARDLADLGAVTDRLDTVGASDGALSNRNLIINGDFSVSQRETYSSSTSIASGAYSVDRWKANDPFNLQRFTGQVIDGTRTNYVKVSYNGTHSMGFMQLVEDKNYERLRGKTITISAYVRTNQALFGFRLYDGSQSYGPRFVADGNWHRATWTFTWSPSSPSYFQIMFDTYQGSFPTIGSGDYMDIAMVQVELGDTATPFEHRPYGDELARCQRYFEAYNGASSSGYMPMGMAWTTNEPRFDIRYLEKRVAPTISLKSGSILKSYNAGSGTEHNWSNFNVDDATTKTALLYGNNSMAATQGYAIQTRLIGNILIDAEL